MFIIPTEVGNTVLSGNIPRCMDKNKWNFLCTKGLKSNIIRLAHRRTIHYQNYMRFPSQKEKLKQVINVLSCCFEDDRKLKFNKLPDSDEQKETSEIIGTAIGIEAIARSSNIIHSANFIKLSRSSRKKSPDYEVNLIGYPKLTLEVKGRGNAGLKLAISSCNKQLSGILPPKYALISKIKYDQKTCCKLYIADPNIPKKIPTRREVLITNLKHYAKCMWWAGFYQFSEVLATRIKEIEYAEDYLVYDGKSIEDELVRKLGRTYRLSRFYPYYPRHFHKSHHQRDFKYKEDNVYLDLLTHIPAELFNNQVDETFVRLKGYKVGFFVSTLLYEVLKAQNFDEILNFRIPKKTIEIGNGIFVDSLDDGTILYIDATEANM